MPQEPRKECVKKGEMKKKKKKGEMINTAECFKEVKPQRAETLH